MRTRPAGSHLLRLMCTVPWGAGARGCAQPGPARGPAAGQCIRALQQQSSQACPQLPLQPGMAQRVLCQSPEKCHVSIGRNECHDATHLGTFK